MLEEDISMMDLSHAVAEIKRVLGYFKIRSLSEGKRENWPEHIQDINSTCGCIDGRAASKDWQLLNQKAGGVCVCVCL